MIKGKYRIKFLNTKVDNLDMSEAIQISECLIRNKDYNYVVTPNVDHIVKLETDHEFREIYENADLVLVDGMPLVWFSKIIGEPIKEKISGSDYFPKLCAMAAEKGYTVFLLGAGKGVGEKAKINLESKYKGLNIVGTHSPNYGFENDEEEIQTIIKMINDLKPDILAVGLGAPKQEKFIWKYKEDINVSLAVGIGATIDFEAGNVKRAPLWMQKSGLEWFYRFLKEPKRMFKRYFIDDMKFIGIVRKYMKTGKENKKSKMGGSI